MPKRARHDLPAVQDKRARVVELRAQGWTFDRIALEVGYSNGSAASKAWKAAIQQRPDQTVDEVRRQEKTRLEQMDSVMSGIIANPPIKSTSIGRVMWDPRTCTCGVKGDTKREHADDCEVLPVLDAGAVVRASSERRAIGESLRRLVNADAAPSAPVFDEKYLRMLAEVQDARTRMAEQAPAVPLEPLPANYASLSSAEQAEADMARRRRQVDAQRVIIRGELEA